MVDINDNMCKHSASIKKKKKGGEKIVDFFEFDTEHFLTRSTDKSDNMMLHSLPSPPHLSKTCDRLQK